VLAVFSAFGVLLPMAGSLLKEGPIYWGFAAIASAALDWVVGRKVNAKAIASVRSIQFRHKLIYRARHKFMSLPLEIWAAPLALCGLIAIAHGLTTVS
jgi:hypothetical protein